MTPAEHYAEAERLLAEAAQWRLEAATMLVGLVARDDMHTLASVTQQRAQVHATLATCLLPPKVTGVHVPPEVSR